MKKRGEYSLQEQDEYFEKIEEERWLRNLKNLLMRKFH
jgi:hypothetical protein